MQRTLSADIRLLGDTLGEVIRAQAGDALFERVEAMRRAAKQARSAHTRPERQHAGQLLTEHAGTMNAEEALAVARAFTLFFQLTNLAEEIEKVRKLRRLTIESGEAGVEQSFASILESLWSQGATLDECMEVLREVRVGFVFTAHPTEARRRTTERLLARARKTLEVRDRSQCTPVEYRRLDREMRAAIEALWQHGAERQEKPKVLDEVKAGLWYLRHVLLDEAPRVQRRLWHALEAYFGPVDPVKMPVVLRFGSWMGSDRDGNPFVTDDITEQVLTFHRDIAVGRYMADIDALIDPLSAVEDRLPPTSDLSAALAQAEAAVPPDLAKEAAARNPREPFRRLLTLMKARLQAVLDDADAAYKDPSDLIDDLCVMRDALLEVNSQGLANDKLLDLIQRVRVFGFCLAALDIREDARAHRAAVADMLDDPAYPTATPEARIAKLETLAMPTNAGNLSDDTRRVISCFARLSEFHERFGAQAVSTYAISNTESHADVLEVFYLAKLFGLEDALDIVPLLESPDSLGRTGDALGALFDHGPYRAHLGLRGDKQELLVGYSDSMKLGGILASRVRVLEAQRDAMDTCKAHGVTLRVFHGRGGSVSRGGGPTYRAIDAMPRQLVTPDVKLTEQGEVRAHHFEQPDLAARYLEQTVGAVFWARYDAVHRSPERWDGEWAFLGQLAEHSYRAYRELVEAPGLMDYFTEATPLEQVTSLKIASRPAKRRDGALALESLRAIPWVFAWSQSRHIITGWYGVGAALKAVRLQADGEARLREACERSPFLEDVLDNVEMALCKADFEIAERYAALCEDEALRTRIFNQIKEAYDETALEILQVSRQTALLDQDRDLQASIRLRNPYVDTLSYLQVQSLQRLRASECEDREVWQRVARVCVHGIAAGLRNTG